MSKLLINESPMQVLPSLASAIGLNEAIFLQQLHYLLQTKDSYEQDDRRWVRSTIKDWCVSYPWWSDRTIKRIITELADFLETANHGDSWDHTLSYTVNYAALDLLDSVTIDKAKMAQSEDAKMAQSDSDNLAQSSIDLKSSKKSKSKSASPPTPQQTMFGKICEIIGWDYNTLNEKDRGQVAQTAGILSKGGYTVEELDRFWDNVWKQDWRWINKHSRPSLNQLRQEIGKVRSTAPTTTSNSPHYTNSRPLSKAELSRQAVDRVFAKLEAEGVEIE